MIRPLVRVRALVPALLLLAACRDPAAPAVAPERITELPRPLSAAEQQATAGTTPFALHLLRTVAATQPAGNVLVSPFSVAMALGLLTQATDGAAHAAMRDSLGFAGMSREEIGAAYRELVPMLRSLDPKVQLTIVNGVFVQNDFPFEQSFLTAVERDFAAPAQNVDFRTPAGFDVVNAWANASTNGRIPQIVQYTDGIVAILANAVHFDAEWRARFDPARTADGPFTTGTGATVTPPMMKSGEIDARHTADSLVDVIELPYGGDAWAMTIVLPKPGTTVASVVAGLDSTRWNGWMRALAERRAVVEMPKYTTNWKEDLLPSLEAMGVLPGRAAGAFLPMSPRGNELEVSFVNHATWMRVDERGTEAAAVTAVGVGIVSLPSGPLHLVVDRPFLVAIRERLSGTILFLGQISNPTQ